MNKHQARETRRANEMKRQIAAYAKRRAMPRPTPREEPIRRGTPGPLKVKVLTPLGLATGLRQIAATAGQPAKSFANARKARRWLNQVRHSQRKAEDHDHETQ